MTMVDPSAAGTRDNQSVRSGVSGVRSAGPAGRLAVAFVTAAGIVLLDQVSKWLALTWLNPTVRVPVLGDWLGLPLAFNAGTVLSLGSGVTWVFTVVGIGAMIALPVVAARARTYGSAAALGLIWGGAAGNLVDRLFAPPGVRPRPRHRLPRLRRHVHRQPGRCSPGGRRRGRCPAAVAQRPTGRCDLT